MIQGETAVDMGKGVEMGQTKEISMNLMIRSESILKKSVVGQETMIEMILGGVEAGNTPGLR